MEYKHAQYWSNKSGTLVAATGTTPHTCHFPIGVNRFHRHDSTAAPPTAVSHLRCQAISRALMYLYIAAGSRRYSIGTIEGLLLLYGHAEHVSLISFRCKNLGTGHTPSPLYPASPGSVAETAAILIFFFATVSLLKIPPVFFLIGWILSRYILHRRTLPELSSLRLCYPHTRDVHPA